MEMMNEQERFEHRVISRELPIEMILGILAAQAVKPELTRPEDDYTIQDK